MPDSQSRIRGTDNRPGLVIQYQGKKILQVYRVYYTTLHWYIYKKKDDYIQVELQFV